MRTALLLLILPLTACTTWDPPAQDPSTNSGILEDPPAESTGWQVPSRTRDDHATVTTTSVTTGVTTGSPDPSLPDPGTGTGEMSPAIDLAALQIVEVHPDPAGKDGGLDSPEFVEILHIGSEPLLLAGLEIVARAWPVVNTDDLGLAATELAPGQRLVIRRHASVAELPAMTPEGDALQVTLVSSSGLRNGDGGVLLRSGEQLGDLMIYGAAQPAPWASRADWLGPAAPAPGSGISLCRTGMVDNDDASDWTPCPPTPGLAPIIDEGKTTSTSTGDPGTTGEALAAELVIVEVLSNPPGPGNTEKYAEFIELENLGPGAVDLADWTIADSLAADASGIDPLLYHSGDGGCAPNTCLAAGQRALIVGNLYAGATGAALVLMTDDTTIANAGLAISEPVVIRDGSAVIRSTYRAWPDPLAEPNPAVTEQALKRVDPSAVDSPAAWSFAAPSPGS